MTEQITLEEALKLVDFQRSIYGGWIVRAVKGNVFETVHGTVYGDVGYVHGNVRGNVNGNIVGNLRGTINGRRWKYVETPDDKLQRLITESGNQELIDAFNELEDN